MGSVHGGEEKMGQQEGGRPGGSGESWEYGEDVRSDRRARVLRPALTTRVRLQRARTARPRAGQTFV